MIWNREALDRGVPSAVIRGLPGVALFGDIDAAAELVFTGFETGVVQAWDARSAKILSSWHIGAQTETAAVAPALNLAIAQDDLKRPVIVALPLLPAAPVQPAKCRMPIAMAGEELRFSPVACAE